MPSSVTPMVAPMPWNIPSRVCKFLCHHHAYSTAMADAQDARHHQVRVPDYYFFFFF